LEADIMAMEDILNWLKKRAEELRRELEIIEALITFIEQYPSTTLPEDLVVSTSVDGVRILLPKPININDVKLEYLNNRLAELVSGRYMLLRDHSGRLKGVLIQGEADEKLIIDVKSVLKATAYTP